MTSRWWIYQRERFPVVAHGALILAFSGSAVALSALLRGGWPTARGFAVACASAFLFFFQLRVADEFKDADDDRRHRPYRPVPRGLVTLAELARLGWIAAAIQLLLALWLDPRLVAVLLLVWTYMALMTREFFAANWLKARPFTYLWSHMLVVPLIDLYATACDWLPAGVAPPAGLGWFLLASFFNGIVVEIGRKLRAPADEEPGVETYSAVWGRPTALAALGAALVLAAGSAALAGRAVGVLGPVAVAGALAVSVLLALSPAYLRRPAAGTGKRFETLSGVWTLAMYLSVGILPLALRWWRTP
jgi:4-hydroxybenzoate polyprenyltransferase